MSLTTALIGLQSALLSSGIDPNEMTIELSHEVYHKVFAQFIQLIDPYTIGTEFKAVGFQFRLRKLERMEGC